MFRQKLMELRESLMKEVVLVCTEKHVHTPLRGCYQEKRKDGKAVTRLILIDAILENEDFIRKSLLGTFASLPYLESRLTGIIEQTEKLEKRLQEFEAKKGKCEMKKRMDNAEERIDAIERENKTWHK